MVSFPSRDDRNIVASRKWTQGQGTKPETIGDRRYSLTYHPIYVSLSWVFNVKISITDVIDGPIIYHEDTIRVLQGGAGGEVGIVGLNHSSENLGVLSKWRTPASTPSHNQQRATPSAGR